MTSQQLMQAATISQIQLMYTQSSTQANDPGSGLGGKQMNLNPLIKYMDQGIEHKASLGDVAANRGGLRQVYQALQGLKTSPGATGTFTVISVSPSPSQATTNAQSQLTAAQQQAAANAQAAQQASGQAADKYMGQ
jgi:hypothetical protein